jgi:ParB family chromosome partitioning protein
MATKPALGKGLASLLPGASVASQVPPPPAAFTATGSGSFASGSATQEVSNKDRHPGIALANIDEISANEFQPRRDFDDVALQELAQSIRENGIIQPLVVRKTLEGFQLIAGERRLRASKLAGLKHVPIVIRKSTDREALELALIENIQRQNLNCIDEALAYFQLSQEFSLTQEELARRVGKERATVANYLRLLRLPEAIIDDLKRQILTFGHGKALLATDDNEIRLRARAQIVERRLSVRDAEALVDQMKRQGAGMATPIQPTQSTGAKTLVQQRFEKLATELGRSYGSKVEIKGGERKGKIVFHFTSRGDLERILNTLQN